MGALNSLPHAIKSLVRNPILLVVAGLYGLVALPQLLVQGLNPLLSSLVSFAMLPVFIVLVPFYQGGIIGMAYEGLDGPTSVRTFIDEGKSNFVSLLAAYLVFTGVAIVLGFVLVIFFAILAAFVLGTSGDSTAGLLVLVGLGLLVFLAYLLIVFFIQFYAHAIVIDDQGLVDGFKRSVGLVRANVVSALGYSLVAVVGMGIAVVLGWIASAVFLLSQQNQTQVALPEPSAVVLAIAAVLYVLSTAISGAFWAAYSTSYYTDLRETVPIGD